MTQAGSLTVAVFLVRPVHAISPAVTLVIFLVQTHLYLAQRTFTFYETVRPLKHVLTIVAF